MRSSTSTLRATGFAVILLSTMAACGGGGGTPSEPTETGGQATGGTGGTVSGNLSKTVSVRNDLFSPANTTVAEGGTVTWSWNTCTNDPYSGSACTAHNVTFDDGQHSATQDHGTFSRTFATAGTYNYHCTIHGTANSGMHGSITVQ